MGSGRRWAFRALRTVSAGQSFARSMCTVCPVACTPVSVRPAACTRRVSPQKAFTARSSEPCTVGWSAWAWKPL
jgi:hypothetical protein